ncbi:MAG: hypothetical protein MJ157_01075 [Clostridia bacterium]|nr:hypothetical protein [Clostridia bacterium]
MKIVEAFWGEYAAGKSEVAVNRALQLAAVGQPVTLVDLDLVEPCYTLAALARPLARQGVEVLGGSSGLLGRGETGNILPAANRWALRRMGCIILDLGYGVEGWRVLNLLEGLAETKELKIWAVLNTKRPLTSNLKQILAHLKQPPHLDGIINNTHLGAETTPEMVLKGWHLLQQAGQICSLPLVASTVLAEILPSVKLPGAVWPMVRWMPQAFWYN